jgi:threonine dehydrogenase-like Zn-dependent dehydrogenase
VEETVAIELALDAPPGAQASRKGEFVKALTVVPRQAGSARLDDVGEPPDGDGPVLVETLAVGVCGTDFEMNSGAYGWAPPGRERLVIGHESLGRVLEAPAGAQLSAGDLVVGIVRRPDPVPCASCAVGEWDFCRNGRYTERGIKERDGYCSERYRIEPDYVVKVDPSLGHLAVLLEPASVLAKGWEQVERIGGRTHWAPRRALVTGAGPIGLLAALLAVQRGLEVHVLDRVTSGSKPELVEGLGATYHTGTIADACDQPDVVMECTGVGSLVFDAMEHMGPGGVVCLTGLSSGGRSLGVDAGMLNRSMVLENEAVVGSVNANYRHYQAAADALARADKRWLGRMISRTVPLEHFEDALRRQPDDIKVCLQVGT